MARSVGSIRPRRDTAVVLGYLDIEGSWQMRKRGLGGIALLMASVLMFAACSSGDKEKDNGGSTEPSGNALSTCEGSAIGNTGLPSDFPVPDAVTFTKRSKLGPSTVVDGFADEELEGMYSEWKDILGQVKYTILFSEEEPPNDAEISYKSADGSSTGQIALRNECGEGKIAVHVTDRPA